MKFLLVCFLLSSSVFASNEKLSNIKSIDSFDLPKHYSEASEETLPYEELSELLDADEFTVVPEARVTELFNTLAMDSQARNRIAGGRCSYRRAYIQGYLKKLSIVSGKLYVECPSNIGHMQLIDQVTGHRYTFSNFHDVNIVAVPNGYNVLDVQFEPRPMTLSEYLGQIEASQKLKPLKDRVPEDRGYCYWSIK